MEEFDRLGREAFLQKHGFGKARDYLVVQGKASYDSKAIAGVAHGYLPGQVALSSDEFSGGESVITKLTALGFTIVGPDHVELPLPGSILNNREIMNRFSVGLMGGMRRSVRRKLLVLISDPFKGLYQDRWEGDVLHYTGMGKAGDQGLSISQNRTLLDSRKTNLAVHLLEARDPLQYTYLGEVELADNPYEEDQPDERGKTRKVWMFPIRLKQFDQAPLPTQRQLQLIEERQARLVAKLPLNIVKTNALRAPKRAVAKLVQTSAFIRNASVAEYVKRLANGSCDLCTNAAPFLNKQKEPYLECHHIVWLARDGEDTVENTVALCPNCHRRMHVLDREQDRRKLEELSKRRWSVLLNHG